ncbi:MAG: DUF1016 N-terminal domain-containing protein, partial [Endomicrobium sp.]|nr:DUF1016 N-terminal domain-containing protein [Endomicrobium sp.]
MKIKPYKNDLADRIAELLQNARNSIVRNVNTTMVVTYFEIGRMIVEDEQKGKNRADYGKHILEDAAKRLSHKFGRGFSQRNLEQMRQFYLVYSNPQIPQTVSAEFKLSWSHYLKLMRIVDENERKFYEIESINNNWSLRELERQYNSALYTRLALSKDKKKILELSNK